MLADREIGLGLEKRPCTTWEVFWHIRSIVSSTRALGPVGRSIVSLADDWLMITTSASFIYQPRVVIMASGDKYLVKMSYLVNTIPCSNTFIYIEDAETGEQDQAGDCMLAFTESMVPKFVSLWSQETQLTVVNCWQIDSTNPPAMALFVGTFGAVVATACPANKNMKFRLRQEVFSTRTNGSLRVAGIPETHTDGNFFTGATVLPLPYAQLAALMVGVIQSPVGDNATFKLAIASSGLEAQAAGTPPLYQDVTAVEIAARVYSDRRRTSKHLSTVVAP